MKTTHCAVFLLGFLCWSSQAQYSARSLTRRINPPPPANGASTNSAAPAPAPAARPAPVVRPVYVAPAPARPVDPEKERAKKDEALRKTIEFQKKRAEQGSAQAQFDLGMRYLKGDGVEKDEAEARRWLEQAAKNDFQQAKKKLEELDKPAN
ncbi:MAG: hypothetical protein AB1813_25170 [Verrucomicrobiota bacterium]